MNNFIQPRPGQKIMYMCTKCKNRFIHEIPKPILGIIKPSVKCPACGEKAIEDPAVMY